MSATKKRKCEKRKCEASSSEAWSSEASSISLKHLAPSQGGARKKCLSWLLDNQLLNPYLEFTKDGEKAMVEQVRELHHFGKFRQFLSFTPNWDEDDEGETNQKVLILSLEKQCKHQDETYTRGQMWVRINITAHYESEEEEVAEVHVAVSFGSQDWYDDMLFKGERFNQLVRQWRVLSNRDDFEADLRKKDAESKILCGVVKALRIVKNYSRCETVVVAEREGRGPRLCGRLYKKTSLVHECPCCRMKRYIKQ